MGDIQSTLVTSIFTTTIVNDNLTKPNMLTSLTTDNILVIGIILFLVILNILIFIYFRQRQKNIERKRVKQTEAGLKKILHYLPTGIILMDSKKTVKQINKAAAKLFELEDVDIILGQTLNKKSIFSQLKIVDTKSVSGNGIRYIIKDSNDNERVIYNERIPFYMQSEEYIIESFYEWTSFIQKKPSTLNTSQTEFIANISHELRTPLNGILGMTDLLLSSGQLANQEMEMTKIAKRSAEILLTLINDILDFSKIESGRFEIESIPFNLEEEITATIKDFVPVATEKRIGITSRLNQVLPTDFIGDPIRIRQVMNNLIDNALKFTHQGKIEITAENWKTVSGGPAILFSIKDTGIGIAQEKLKSIFEPFAQADQSSTRKYGGTGLGTTICKQLVSLMGGEIWAKSPSAISTNPEYPGTELCFSLPLKTRYYQKQLDFSHVFSFSQIKTLIITDDALQVQVLTRNFIALGINYRILPPTRETIEQLKTFNQWHLLIIDHRYDLNGLDFLQELHNHHLHKQSLILVQSSDFHMSNTSLARRLGADTYLRKPIALSQLKNFFLNNFKELNNKALNYSLSIPEEFVILVIEENKLNQKVAGNLLRKLGYETEIATNIEEATIILKQKEINMVLLDSFIPTQDIPLVISTLELNNCKSPIVLMTDEMQYDASIKSYLLTCGISDFIYKPINYDAINQIILKWGVSISNTTM